MMVKDVLVKARSKIEQGWTQGAYARDAYGNVVHEESSRAVRWCLSGAISATGAPGPVKIRARSAIDNALEYVTVVGFNDTSTKAEVLRLIDRVIARLI